jgi:branched-chain amino acid aminotransferase
MAVDAVLHVAERPEEAVLANTRGELCQGIASSVFVETDGRFVTPPVSSDCLPGVRRQIDLEWSKRGKPEIVEQAILFSIWRRFQQSC